ncbi:SDR family NAD(P)-dependent oxidoreductase [Mycobacteroides salmoniphilum]|uniref:SDR family NAD(P)-dependent oxidoreductase n=1 Tax=Mycobacteroides salmoniphilum TaxID=404941 RepID=UPI001064DBA3|nr:SDR family NAD(P)-dependent oxidoreductase [Mycobacteroides salmoniphilum]
MFGLEKLRSFGRGQGNSHGARAVVTGAGSGIGRAFALELAARGGNVICADIDKDRADQTAKTIERVYGRSAHAFHCDVAKRADMENLVMHADLIFNGPPTLIVNNAGVGIGGRPVGDIGLDDWKWTLDINLGGVIHGCELFGRQLRDAGRGGIINVASAAGFAAAPQMASYNVSKAGVMSLSETMASEFVGTDVTVTVLCPTLVKTNVIADGRIPVSTLQFGQKLMGWFGFAPDRVARLTLDAHDRGKLYVMPQPDAILGWYLKRHYPVQWMRVLGLVQRLLPSEETTRESSVHAAVITEN